MLLLFLFRFERTTKFVRFHVILCDVRYTRPIQINPINPYLNWRTMRWRERTFHNKTLNQSGWRFKLLCADLRSSTVTAAAVAATDYFTLSGATVLLNSWNVIIVFLVPSKGHLRGEHCLKCDSSWCWRYERWLAGEEKRNHFIIHTSLEHRSSHHRGKRTNLIGLFFRVSLNLSLSGDESKWRTDRRWQTDRRGALGAPSWWNDTFTSPDVSAAGGERVHLKHHKVHLKSSRGGSMDLNLSVGLCLSFYQYICLSVRLCLYLLPIYIYLYLLI